MNRGEGGDKLPPTKKELTDQCRKSPICMAPRARWIWALGGKSCYIDFCLDLNAMMTSLPLTQLLYCLFDIYNTGPQNVQFDFYIYQ